MANINWVMRSRNSFGSEADVMITLNKGKGGEAVCFYFKPYVVRTRFGESKRIAFGYDKDTSRLYIVPSDGANSYSIYEGKSKDARSFARLNAKRFDGIVATSALLGNFNLEFDPTERAYYIDYSEVMRFQSKKIREI